MFVVLVYLLLVLLVTIVISSISLIISRIVSISIIVTLICFYSKPYPTFYLCRKQDPETFILNARVGPKTAKKQAAIFLARFSPTRVSATLAGTLENVLIFGEAPIHT